MHIYMCIWLEYWTSVKCTRMHETENFKTINNIRLVALETTAMCATVVSCADPVGNVSWMLFPIGTELGTQAKTGSRAGSTHSQ